MRQFHIQPAGDGAVQEIDAPRQRQLPKGTVETAAFGRKDQRPGNPCGEINRF